MTDFSKRLQKLEVKRASRQGSGLSSERRKLLTDRAVFHGDQEALQDLSALRSTGNVPGTSEQRAAATAAALRADS
jgi:hypothetical protein